MLPSSLKCVVIGDDEIGKSSLVRRFVFDDFSSQYVPTAQDDYTVYKRFNKTNKNGLIASHKITVNVCDTGGQPELDRLRPLCYSKVDVVIVCFSVVNPESFKNVTSKWLPEIKRHTVNNDVPVVLVGTQADLRSNLHVLLKLEDDGLAPVSESRALKLAKKVGAQTYIECSALTKKNVKHVFDVSLLRSLGQTDKLLCGTKASASENLSKGIEDREQTKNLKEKALTDKSFICGSDSVLNVITNNVINCGASPSGNLLSRQQRRSKKHSKLKRLLFMSCFPL